MKIGIPFEEKLLEQYTLSDYLKKLKALSIDFVEVALNFDAYSIEFYSDVLRLFRNNDIKIHYHLPHFYNQQLDLTNFCANNPAFDLFLYQLKKVHPINQASTIVIHGAKYEHQDKSAAYQKTLEAIEYLLNFFEVNNLPLTIALETLNAKKHKVIGDNREDILSIVETINSPAVGICWDITHDFLTLETFKTPTEAFLDKILHLHIHGVNEKDHLSLAQSTIDFKEHLKLINTQLNNVPITIELLGSTHFFQEITNSLPFLETKNHVT
jgi:sugar phosphate isomerase/epimerase